ncbi:hypothetical protein, partial [Lysobacter sp. A3-1-A15]|uniref:hypothetical protein n=1 Tax=Novilysobacter viscosus TaxID=3098602 RepID=UPI002ED89C8B
RVPGVPRRQGIAGGHGVEAARRLTILRLFLLPLFIKKGPGEICCCFISLRKAKANLPQPLFFKEGSAYRRGVKTE